ncbi:MAG TPA: hypothetical protein PK231_05795, partial [Acidocella sp.]|nr:hypothetical protein [Acidocella sp.]
EDAEAERLYQEAMAVWEKVIPSLRDIKAAIGAFFNIRASGAFSSLDYIMAGRHLEDFYESIVDADDQCAELVQRYEKQELQDDLFEAASELAVERWEGDD